MYHYVNHFFSDNHYRKLVIHFDINDICHAEASVDRRMQMEIKDGAKIVENLNANVNDIVSTNKGGPYGSKVLKDVLKDGMFVFCVLILMVILSLQHLKIDLFIFRILT